MGTKPADRTPSGTLAPGTPDRVSLARESWPRHVSFSSVSGPLHSLEAELKRSQTQPELNQLLSPSPTCLGQRLWEKLHPFHLFLMVHAKEKPIRKPAVQLRMIFEKAKSSSERKGFQGKTQVHLGCSNQETCMRWESLHLLQWPDRQ